mgnify:CR=1 FL=1
MIISITGLSHFDDIEVFAAGFFKFLIVFFLYHSLTVSGGDKIPMNF